jgi:hypothetical protein
MGLVRRALGIATVLVLVVMAFGGGWITGRFGLGAKAIDPARQCLRLRASQVSLEAITRGLLAPRVVSLRP